MSARNRSVLFTKIRGQKCRFPIKKPVNFEIEKKKLITGQTDIFSIISIITDKVENLAEPKN